jgi:hypothetical protein
MAMDMYHEHEHSIWIRACSIEPTDTVVQRRKKNLKRNEMKNLKRNKATGSEVIDPFFRENKRNESETKSISLRSEKNL